MKPDFGRVEDHFETTDGSAPEGTGFDPVLARKLPLTAFGVLDGGDVFEVIGGRPPADGPAKAAAWAQSHFVLEAHGAPAAQVERVRKDAIRQLAGNPQLPARLVQARPIAVDLIPPGKALSAYGYPRSVSRLASGLFWDKPEWPRARIALRQDRLEQEPHLVFHELAHAIMFLAFTSAEQDQVHRAMLRTYRSKRAVDEVFALYSEREFVAAPSEEDLRAPGVYGQARQRWDEGHVFTRFVRNLYFPYKPLAGPGGPPGGGLQGSRNPRI